MTILWKILWLLSLLFCTYSYRRNKDNFPEIITAGAGHPPNGTKSCTPMVNTLLPASEIRSAHSFCAVFTAAPSQSGSGSGLSFCTTQSQTLAQLVTDTHVPASDPSTQPQNSLHTKNSSSPLKHLWGSSLSETSGHLSALKLMWRKRRKKPEHKTAPTEGTKTLLSNCLC